MDLEQAEALAREFLGRASEPPRARPEKTPRKGWKAKRSIGDEDLAALDALMRRMLDLDEFDVRRLARRLGVEPSQARSDPSRGAQARYHVFQYLKTQIINLREKHGTQRAEAGQRTEAPQADDVRPGGDR